MGEILIWIPGHRDMKGNCEAQDFAKLGMTKQILSHKEHIGLPFATHKQLLKEDFTCSKPNKDGIYWYVQYF